MNKEYINILQIISRNRRTICGETYCPLSQSEMAVIADLTCSKVNSIIKNLSCLGMVKKFPHVNRKYTITENGRRELKRLK